MVGYWGSIGIFLFSILTSSLFADGACKDTVVKGAQTASLRVAVVQYPMERLKDASAWEQKLARYVERAAKGKADVVLFPELIAIEGMALINPEGDKPKEAIRELARELTPRFVQLFAQLSDRHGITIIAGSWPESVGEKVVNSSFVFAKGVRVHTQSKNHLTHGEKHFYALDSSGKNAESFALPGGVDSAIAICFDSEFPNYLPYKEGTIPEVIFVPSMTEDDFGRFRVARSASARAVEYHAYVVVTGTVGGDAEDVVLGAHVGQAKVFTPSDKAFPANGVLASGKLNQEAILFADLDLATLRKSRETSTTFPVKQLHE